MAEPATRLGSNNPAITTRHNRARLRIEHHHLPDFAPFSCGIWYFPALVQPYPSGSKQNSDSVRFGSKADTCSAQVDVRFTPNSGHVQCNSVCPLCAKSGHSRARLKCLTGQQSLCDVLNIEIGRL